jgi:hypothetical protein
MRGAEVGEGDSTNMAAVTRSVTDIKVVASSVTDEMKLDAFALTKIDQLLIRISLDSYNIATLIFCEHQFSQTASVGTVYHFKIDGRSNFSGHTHFSNSNEHPTI